MIWDLDGIAPHIAPDAWVAPDAQLMGKIVLEAQSSVWFGAVLRGDNEEIRLGRGAVYPACKSNRQIGICFIEVFANTPYLQGVHHTHISGDHNDP